MATSWKFLCHCKGDLFYYIYIFLNMYLQWQDVFGYFKPLGAHDLWNRDLLGLDNFFRA